MNSNVSQAVTTAKPRDRKSKSHTTTTAHNPQPKPRNSLRMDQADSRLTNPDGADTDSTNYYVEASLIVESSASSSSSSSAALTNTHTSRSTNKKLKNKSSDHSSSSEENNSSSSSEFSSESTSESVHAKPEIYSTRFKSTNKNTIKYNEMPDTNNSNTNTKQANTFADLNLNFNSNLATHNAHNGENSNSSSSSSSTSSPSASSRSSSGLVSSVSPRSEEKHNTLSNTNHTQSPPKVVSLNVKQLLANSNSLSAIESSSTSSSSSSTSSFVSSSSNSLKTGQNSQKQQRPENFGLVSQIKHVFETTADLPAPAHKLSAKLNFDLLSPPSTPTKLKKFNVNISVNTDKRASPVATCTNSTEKPSEYMNCSNKYLSLKAKCQEPAGGAQKSSPPPPPLAPPFPPTPPPVGSTSPLKQQTRYVIFCVIELFLTRMMTL